MEARTARRAALAGWLLEISALLAVFPVLDQLVREEPFNWTIAGAGTLFALLFLFVGVTLTRG
jgi:hypothetical protein